MKESGNNKIIVNLLHLSYVTALAGISSCTYCSPFEVSDNAVVRSFYGNTRFLSGYWNMCIFQYLVFSWELNIFDYEKPDNDFNCYNIFNLI